MSDLISRSALMCEIDWLNRSYPEDCKNEVAEKLVKLIEQAPTVDAEPVRHGGWISKKVDAIETEFQCSKCGRTVECGNDYFGKPTKHVSSAFPYCHCGAKMEDEHNVI